MTTSVRRRFLRIVVALGLVAASPIVSRSQELPPPSPTAADFAHDVQPIFARACRSCHGPEKQRSGFRLDERGAALKGGELGPAIVPRKSAESPLIRYVAGLDKDLRMPPEGPLLSPLEIGVLRRWIDDGAHWPDEGAATPKLKDWWSLQPPASAPVPKILGAAGAIDAFLLEKLTAAKLSPAPVANRATLIRRLYFDLLGLPPDAESMAAFIADSAPDAYDRLVDRLLASPRHGERWARHWLDVVHFAETHGHDQDRPRDNAWPYRDYVIAAFNRDTPYPRFIQEQIAADGLFPEQPELTPALGFLAAGPWDESTLRDIREDTLDRENGRYLDRDDIVTNVMSAFAGLTVHCARCHDHKFDPIPQAEYYGLQAVFAGVEKAEKQFDADAATFARRKELERRKIALEAKDADAITRLLTDISPDQLLQWERDVAAAGDRWTVLAPETLQTEKGTVLARQADHSLLATGARPETETTTLTAAIGATEIHAVRVETLTDDSLPQRGPGRQDNGNLHVTEFRLRFAAAETPNEAQSLKLQNPTADFNQAGWEIAKAIDGNPQTAWGIYPEVGKPHAAVFELATPLKTAGGKLSFVIEQHHGRMHTIGRVRVSFTSRPSPAEVTPVPASILALLAKPPAQRTEDERREIAVRFLTEQNARALKSLPPQRVVYAGTNQFIPNGSQRPFAKPRKVSVLRRGEITKPLAEVSPGVLSCISGPSFLLDPTRTDDEAARRIALARWLSDPQNPLVWRSLVNRVWHYHFGKGLVDSPNDFGRMGGKPSHLELIDRLAIDFRDGGGSLKDLHRRLVTTDAYRRSCDHDPAAAAVDGDNRLLWRMNRKRLDAETVKDAASLFSDRLDLAMGGPSVRQFVMSPGIHVTPKVDYAAFDVDSPANHRRSVYRFLFRTLPDPLMDALDCPAGDQSAPVRSESVTALQALTMLNNRFLVRQCEHIAARLERMEASPEGRIQAAFRLILNREPSAAESAEFVEFATKHGAANVCRVLLNSNEFLFVN